MTAMDERKDGWIDYLPMAAFLGYWLYAGLLAALATGDRRLLLLGLITLPALAAMAAAVRRTARGRRLG